MGDSFSTDTTARMEPAANLPLARCIRLIDACPCPDEETKGITTESDSKSK